MTLYRSFGTPIAENVVPEINNIVLGYRKSMKSLLQKHEKPLGDCTNNL